MKRWLRIAQCMVLVGVAAGLGRAQLPLTENELSRATLLFSNAPSRSSLPCYIEIHKKPRLDFLFRYTGEFIIDCHLGKAIPPGAKLFALLKITPNPALPN